MEKFKAPDVTASRFRPEVYNVLNKDLIDKFKKKYPKYKKIDDVFLRKILKKFNQSVAETVIDVRDGVQLPEQVGWLFIGTCKQSKKANIDYAKSKKYGVQVSNKNWDTDGKLAKIFFTSYATKHKVKNREFWKFVACRDFKRAVAKTYPENWNIYVEVDNSKWLKQAYTKAYLKEKYINETKLALKTYNDFEL